MLISLEAKLHRPNKMSIHTSQPQSPSGYSVSYIQAGMPHEKQPDPFYKSLQVSTPESSLPLNRNLTWQANTPLWFSIVFLKWVVSFPVPLVFPFPSTTCNLPKRLKQLQWNHTHAVSFVISRVFLSPTLLSKERGSGLEGVCVIVCYWGADFLRTGTKSGLTGFYGGLFLAHARLCLQLQLQKQKNTIITFL